MQTTVSRRRDARRAPAHRRISYDRHGEMVEMEDPQDAVDIGDQAITAAPRQLGLWVRR